MKHASIEALDSLEPPLDQIRRLPGLRERKRGSFDSRIRVSVHFHEDEDHLYADLRVAGATTRLPVDNATQQHQLLTRLAAATRDVTLR